MASCHAVMAAPGRANAAAHARPRPRTSTFRPSITMSFSAPCVCVLSAAPTQASHAARRAHLLSLRQHAPRAQRSNYNTHARACARARKTTFKLRHARTHARDRTHDERPPARRHGGVCEACGAAESRHRQRPQRRGRRRRRRGAKLHTAAPAHVRESDYTPLPQHAAH